VNAQGRGVPHLRIVETCVLPKPYKTVVPTGIYGSVPSSFSFGLDPGEYWSQGNDYGSTGVLLMHDTTGIVGSQ